MAKMRNFRWRQDLIHQRKSTPGVQMANEQVQQNHPKRRGGMPLAVVIAIAVVGVLGMLIVDHGPWNKPRVQTAAMAHYSTTGEAAHAAGAVVMPTEPKPKLEPEAPGPKPVHPANPAPP
jgi:hypothetical protein